MPDPKLAVSGKTPRMTDTQARLLLELSAGYVRATLKDAYAALRKKGCVEDSDRHLRGDVEYKLSAVAPRVTPLGRAALCAHVEKYGRLEIEFLTPLADYSTVIRMDPKETTDA